MSLNSWAAGVRAAQDRAERFGNLPKGTRVRFDTGDRRGSGEIRGPHPDGRGTYAVLTQTRPGSGVMATVEVRPSEVMKVTRKATA